MSRPLSSLIVAEHSPGELRVDLAGLAEFVRTTGPLAVVDLETTGLSDDPAAEILEFGAVLLEPGRDSLTTLESLVRPGAPLPVAIPEIMTPPTSYSPGASNTRSWSPFQLTPSVQL